MSETVDKEFLYRKLEQARRLIAGPLYPLTTVRLKLYADDVQRQLAVMEARDTDAPTD